MIRSQSQKVLSKTELQNFSGNWKILGKDVIRNSQGGQTLPTLETINHRLNIFKQKVEKIDYLEILQKETQNKPEENKTQKQQQAEKSQQRSQSENAKVSKDDENLNQDEQDITYFSFKKKMQLALHKRQQLLKEEEEKKQKLQKERTKKVLPFPSFARASASTTPAPPTTPSRSRPRARTTSTTRTRTWSSKPTSARPSTPSTSQLAPTRKASKN